MACHHQPGDKVFAKIKGFSNWPARINPLPPDVQIPKGKLPVFFYGTYQVSFVPVKNIVPYDEFKSKWGKPKSNPQFMAAMEEIESNPGILMLGEDPRAEQFLQQFYTFKPGVTAVNENSDKKSSKAERQKSLSPHSSVSYTSVSSSPTHAPSNHSHKTQSKTGVHSETSSELSSAFSKQDSSEIAGGSDYEEVIEDGHSYLRNHSAVGSTCSGANLPISTDPTSATEEVDLQTYEAQKLARRLQRKAEKKALKKAAKKQAKRLAKEAERANRRALREAKRERKRQHKLEKRRMLEQKGEPLEGEHQFGVVPDEQWNVVDDTAESADYLGAFPSTDLPYEELIAAELQGDVLSPNNNDRSTSPSHLEDLIPGEFSQDPPDSGLRESPSSPQQWPTSRDGQTATKRNATSPNDRIVTSPCELEPSWSSEPKRAKPEKRSLPQKSLQTSEADSPNHKPSSGKVHNTSANRKRPGGRRRRLLEDDSDTDLVHESADVPQQVQASHLAANGAGKSDDSRNTPEQLSSPMSSSSDKKDSIESKLGEQEEVLKTNGNVHHSTAKSRHRTTNSRAPTSQSHPVSPSPPDVVTQLRHLCRDLKASLVRGHENFSAAVEHINELTKIPFRLPQLAQVWDLMDCIKKCRRYKLSAEVREAAQNTLRSLQTIQSNATKEELAETQALVAAYQQRSHPPSTAETVKKSPKLPNPADLMPSINPSPTQTSAPQYTTTDTSSTVTAPSPSVVKTPEPAPQVSNADLDAKVDDMLSLIRATEERMAAASYRSVQNTRFPPLPISTTTATNTVESGRLGHSTIRASAVAAAAAHMHDEEDEESIVSRIEQVAAFEEAASKQSHTSRLSPPPPPPPLPQSTTSSSFQRVSPGSSVDLDLDSRIEMLITGPKAYTARDQSLATAKTNLPSSLLARRQAIADKVAAKKAGEMSTTVSGKNRKNQPSSKDDELYDLLGV